MTNVQREKITDLMKALTRIVAKKGYKSGVSAEYCLAVLEEVMAIENLIELSNK